MTSTSYTISQGTFGDARMKVRVGTDEKQLVPGRDGLTLVLRLCDALAKDGVSYCHWKSNNALERSANGENDLDLLISRADRGRFAETVCRLGLKLARAPIEKQMSGVSDYFGYDRESGKIVHVHAHYRLVVGHDTTKNYHIPIEEPYLASANQGNLFRIPAPEYEFIIFIIRMVLKHFTWDSILDGDARLRKREREEYVYLSDKVDADRVRSILERELPYLDPGLFDSCKDALGSSCPPWTSMKIGLQLRNALRANARRPPAVDAFLRVFRRAVSMLQRHLFRRTGKYRLEGGGAMIALVGGDGAGKSTALDSLYSWTVRTFESTYVHMGKPAWSWVTIAVRGILKVGQLIGLYPLEASFETTLKQESLVSPGYPWMLREVCRARDRYCTFVSARRRAIGGGLVFFDRFPMPQIQLMDGPQIERFISRLTNGSRAKQWLEPTETSRLARYLARLEGVYYQRMVPPDLVAVLRLDPESAVQRKTDEDPAEVRARSTEVWNANWEGANVDVIDASKSREEVVAELKALVWSHI